MKKVVLIGANGLVGSEFRNHCAGKYEIITVTRANTIQDLNISSCEAVIFTAQSGAYREKKFAQDLFNVNVQLAYEAAHFFADKCPQFIFFSTGSVYDMSETEVFNENSPIAFNSSNPYVASKIAGESLVSAFSSFYDNLTILRPFAIYGKHQRQTMLIPRMFGNVLNQKPITLSGEKGLVFNPIHGKDVAQLLDKLITSDDKGHFIYNVAGEEVISLRELVNELGRHLNVAPIVKITGNQDKVMIAKHAIPIWKASISLQEGLSLTFDKE